jgi:hypothetical protein
MVHGLSRRARANRSNSLMLAASVLVGVSSQAFAADCWETSVPGGSAAQGGDRATLYSTEFRVKDPDKTQSIIQTKQKCDVWKNEDLASRSCSDSASGVVACEAQQAAEMKDASPARQFAEQAITAGLTILVVGTGFDPSSIVAAVGIQGGTMVLLDAYDRDRGDAKRFLEKAGGEVSQEKLDEWKSDPANSFKRSDPGQAAEQAKDTFNRGDISKACGCKF